MKKILLYVLTVAAIFVFLNDHLFAQERRTYNFKDFTGVSTGWGMDVIIDQSSSYSIEVEADEDDLEVLKVEKDGGMLEFYIDKMFYRKRGDITIRIKMPVLTNLDLSGGSHGRINMNVASKDFEADVSGGAVIEGRLTCGDASFNLSGGATAKLEGKAENLTVEGSGGSIFKMKGFSVKDVNADLSGGSQVTITMNGTINTDQSGGSRLVYYGSARIGNTDFSGGSGISRGD